MKKWIAVYEIVVTKRISVEIDLPDGKLHSDAAKEAEALLEQRDNGIWDVPLSNYREFDNSAPVLQGVYSSTAGCGDVKPLKDWLIPP